MDFIDEVRTRSGRFAKRIEHLETEEATKSALVLPFIQMLGYEIFDPTEVVPEFTADVGTKKGEKVDYALIQDGKPAILIECKKYGSNLDEAEISQLLRYFTVTAARFGILTDGIVYRLFSDLDQPNVMDTKPFFEFNMLDFTDIQVTELRRFTKSAFAVREIVDAARELKYTTEIKRILAEELAAPSKEFVRFFLGRVYQGRITPAARDQFGSLAKQAFAQFINDRVNTRLKSALEQGDDRTAKPADGDGPSAGEEHEVPELVPLELEAFQIIKAIVRDVVDVHRLNLEVYKRHTSVHLDNYRLVCRLRLRTKSLSMGLISDDGTEERILLNDLDDIFGHADGLRATVASIEDEKTVSAAKGVEVESDLTESQLGP